MLRRQRSPIQVVGKALRELRRGIEIARDGGGAAGWIFLREEVIRNTWTRLSRPVSADRARVECNVCGWRGPRFMTHCGAGYVNYDAFCPRCMCYPRHRGFAELLEHGLGRELANLRARGGKRIFFAPEPGMRSLLERYVSGLEGVDIRRINELVVHVEDIQKLSFADGSIDFFSCFHVVEHVPDPDAALRELVRVLNSDGLSVFNVPMTFGRRETIAFGRPNPLANGHWFDFGEDFVERLVAAGFSGTGYRLRAVLSPARFEALRLQDEMIFLLSRACGASAVIRDDSGNVLAQLDASARTS
jgi:SAM-dependent methyltransferase